MKNIIDQGKFEVFVDKDECIEKLMQIQGFAHERLSNGNGFNFFCYKDGKISMTHPPSRSISADNATVLCGQVVEQDGKTYVSYYTEYRNTVRFMKYFGLIFYILLAIVCIVITVITREKTALLLSIFFLGINLVHLITNPNEKVSAPDDSKILVNELKKRVEAVNLWDK